MVSLHQPSVAYRRSVMRTTVALAMIDDGEEKKKDAAPLLLL